MSEGMQEVTSSIKEIVKGLRELKRLTPLAFQMLKLFSEGQDSSAVSSSESCVIYTFVPERRRAMTKLYVHVLTTAGTVGS